MCNLPLCVRRLGLAGCVLLLGLIFSLSAGRVDASAAAPTAAPLSFSISLATQPSADVASGRLCVYLVPEDLNPRGEWAARADGAGDRKLVYAIDVKDARVGATFIVDSRADFAVRSLDQLAPGKWQAQAVFDIQHNTSSWFSETGNPISTTVRFDLPAKEPVKLELNELTAGSQFNDRSGVEFVSVRSKLLSDFRQRDVVLHAAVIKPAKLDPNRRYPAVYAIPGFGGRATMATRIAELRSRVQRDPDADTLSQIALEIWLDPEGPNGHTLFADSAVNGPCARALIEELIPAIEAKYPQLISHPAARVVTGHSSGGWSSLWLGTQYPQTFGKVWSTAPDPIDFRKFQLINLYDDASFYTDAKGTEISSMREGNDSTLTVREENADEHVLGPGNRSAQQWDSWMAVWGSRDAEGWPADLFDAKTGAIDRAEAERYKPFDLGLQLRTQPEKMVPIWRDHVRIVVGDRDTYYLNEAVQLVKTDLQKLDTNAGKSWGYIKLVSGADHSSVLGSADAKQIPGEMLQYFLGEPWKAK
jgi:hypothetical protein